jgi:hypothetical protein
LKVFKLNSRATSTRQLIGLRQRVMLDPVSTASKCLGNILLTKKKQIPLQWELSCTWTTILKNTNWVPSFREFLVSRKRVGLKLLELFGNTLNLTGFKNLRSKTRTQGKPQEPISMRMPSYYKFSEAKTRSNFTISWKS